MAGRSRRTGRFLLAFLAALLFLLPLYWVLVASLKQPGLPPSNRLEWWPAAAHWENYRTVFTLVPMGRYIGNSLLVVAAAIPITLVTASWAGLALAQLGGQARRRYLTLTVGLLIIPAASVWLFRFQILRWLGLLSSLWALITPAFAASNPLFVLLYFWSFRRIPGELFEAARLDGASVWQTWWRLALPLTRPTTVAVTVLTFMMYWGDFISPVLYLYDPGSYTAPVGLQLINQLDATNWPLLMAGAVVMTLPAALLFLLLQRYFLGRQTLAELFGRN
ncbi:MAG: carbohydrate ABC transporter permease [Anaerolineales bacterium]|nr:carbohydrate ABC transporter permease [Anaerolineales bacterium]